MKTCPVIVIGHVDHGKTSLVRALTGTDTDRLPEERARGLSITAGYAWLQCGEVMIDLIDAPGHEKFIPAMVAGASGAACALLVVSAAEGVRAQTLEHLEVACALGIGDGIVAVTKADLVPGAEHARIEAELRGTLAATRFQDAPVIFCSSVTGKGLGDLQGAFTRLAAGPVRPVSPSAAFLAVDRVFVADGHGTVVTGTLLGAPLKPDDPLVLSPAGQPAVIRAIQVRGQAVPEAQPGERTALNLRGVAAGAVKRGDVVHLRNAFSSGLHCDVLIEMSGRASRPIRHMEEIRVLIGTAQATGTLRLLAARQVGPGEAGLAQIRFAAPVTAFAGQRAILRSLSPAEMLGSAIILDPAAAPVKARKDLRLETLKAACRGQPRPIAAALAAEHRGVASLKDVCRLTRLPAGAVRSALGEAFIDVDGGLISTAAAGEARADYLTALAAYHTAHRLRLFAPRAEVHKREAASALTGFVEAELEGAGEIIVSRAGVALAGHDPAGHLSQPQADRMAALERLLKTQGLAPAGPAAFTREQEDADLLSLLIHHGRVIRLNNISLKQEILLHADAVAMAAQELKAAYPGQVAFTTGEARAALNTSRKYIVPLLEHFDTVGLTFRRADMRHLG